MIQEGDKFGRLTVKRLIRVLPLYCEVECECGVVKQVSASNLRSNNTRSCGCLRREIMPTVNFKHGMHETSEYMAWQTMINRCYNVCSVHYEWYGFKGVKVYEPWREDFTLFYKDVGPKPTPSHFLSRKDRTKSFTPGNTYWATPEETYRNRSNNKFYTVGRKTMCLQDWANESGINKSTLHYRLASGLTMAQALKLGHGTRGKFLSNSI